MDTDQTTAITTTDDSNAIASTEAMNQSTMALLTNTFEWLQYAMSLVGTDKHDELSSALTEVNERIAHIQAVHITNFAKLNGAMTMAIELTEQRDQLLAQIENHQDELEEAFIEGTEEGYTDGLNHASECPDCYHEMEVARMVNVFMDAGPENAKRLLQEEFDELYNEAREQAKHYLDFDPDNDEEPEDSDEDDDPTEDSED